MKVNAMAGLRDQRGVHTRSTFEGGGESGNLAFIDNPKIVLGSLPVMDGHGHAASDLQHLLWPDRNDFDQLAPGRRRVR